MYCCHKRHFKPSIKMRGTLLIIDNYDSFTYNLFHAFGKLGVQVEVHRNDQISIKEIEEKVKPRWIVISPGPGTPQRAGISLKVVKYFAGSVPLLGVCLGHQCIGEVWGAQLRTSCRLLHGKTTPVFHDGAGIFGGLPNPITVMRYNSLVVEKDSVCPPLRVSAVDDAGEVMGLRHDYLPVEGVQFHPESYKTELGLALLENFLRM